MAEQWLEKIYSVSNYVSELKRIVQFLWKEQDDLAFKTWNSHIDDFIILEELVQENCKELFPVISSIRNSISNMKDGKGLEKLLCIELIPLCMNYISSLGQINVKEGKYQLVSSQMGFLCMKDLQKNILVHSLHNPMEEAQKLAQKLYSPRYTSFHIWGNGLGYLAYAIWKESYGAADIYVYEDDEVVTQYAVHYGVLEWIERDKLHIIKDKTAQIFVDNINEILGNYYITNWGVLSSDKAVQDKLYRLFLNRQFHLEEDIALKMNFWRNISGKSIFWNELKISTIQQSIIVAAGPSLDNSLAYLKEQKGKKAIISVGTVYRKLLKNGIEPDLVVILESSELVYEQIDGLEKQEIPMLLSLFSLWKVKKYYQGPVYFAPVSNDEDVVRIARENNLEVWEAGGTVSLFAIEAAVRLGAKELELVGLDLSFPEGVTHAKDTARREKIEGKNVFEVESVSGGTVLTDIAFDLYRREIEEFICENPHIRFWNLSKNGARISGSFEKEI